MIDSSGHIPDVLYSLVLALRALPSDHIPYFGNNKFIFFISDFNF